MNTLTKAEINTLIFSLEELIRNGEYGDSDIEKIGTLHAKLKLMYTTFARAEKSETKKAYCMVCGGELSLKVNDD